MGLPSLNPSAESAKARPHYQSNRSKRPRGGRYALGGQKAPGTALRLLTAALYDSDRPGAGIADPQKKETPAQGRGSQVGLSSCGSLLLVRGQATLDLLPSAERRPVNDDLTVGIHPDHAHVPHLPHCSVTKDGLEENVGHILVRLSHR